MAQHDGGAWADTGQACRGRVHSIDTLGTVDGPGIRFLIFFQGCPLRCLYCHNPDARALPEGVSTEAWHLVEQAEQYRSFFERSGGGVTLTGGEPLFQPEFALEILQLCRERGIHTALDTSGFARLEKVREVLELADLVLLDIKSFDPMIYRRVTGVSIEPTLKVAEYLRKIRKPVWLRFVLVPGLTDDASNIEALADYVSRLGNIVKVQILPFHKMGEHKWERLEASYALKDTPEPTPAQIEAASAAFRRRGLVVE